MADVRLLVQEEGRSARNLIAFNVPVVTSNTDRVTRKPPSIPRAAQSASMKRSVKTTARVRSASTGRDKKSEQQARHWAFLFGNLQRAVDGIYQTCEEDESISECKEVILVLENYTRDFHNLIEWFKVKWAYESAPPPLRRAPLAWEVRKTSPGRTWGSQGVPKSTSPVQRMSPTGPTCRSPIDQTIIENRSTINDNKISQIKEESVLNTGKDNRSSAKSFPKCDARNLNEKCKNLIEKGTDQVPSKGKSASTKIAPKAVLKRPAPTKMSDNNAAESKVTNKLPANDTKYNSDATNATKPVMNDCNSTFDSKSMSKQTSNDIKVVQKVKVTTTEMSSEVMVTATDKKADLELKNAHIMNTRVKDANKSSESNGNIGAESALADIQPINDNVAVLEMRNNRINAEAENSNKPSQVENKIVLGTENENITNAEIENKPTVYDKTLNKEEKLLVFDGKTSETKSVEPCVNNHVVLETNIPGTADSQSINSCPGSDVSDKTDTNSANKSPTAMQNNIANKTQNKPKPSVRPAYSTVSRMRPSTAQPTRNWPETPKMIRSKTTLGVKGIPNMTRVRPGTSVLIRRRLQTSNPNEISEQQCTRGDQNKDLSGSVEVLTKQGSNSKTKDESDGWQTVRSRYRRGSTHNLNMATRFHKPSTATSLPALSIESPSEKCKKSCLTPDENYRTKKKSINGKIGKNIINEVEKVKGSCRTKGRVKDGNSEKDDRRSAVSLGETNSTSMIAAIFKSEAELLEKRIQQFMAAQAERERIFLEDERRREEADSQRSQQLSDEEASLQRQIQELESTDIDVDTETDETDGETVLEIEGEETLELLEDAPDDISLEDRYENMLEGMSWAERVDTLAQLQALVARHPGRALELHQKLSSPSRKRSLPETLRRYQAKQACAQRKRQNLLMEKSQRLRELLNKVEDVKSAKNQLIEEKRIRMETKLKKAEENRTQHLLEIVRKAHDEDSKLKEIAFINELEAQNKRHDFMALCQEQEERLQGIQEERQRRQEEKAAKEAAAEERRRALEVERLLRIQRMRQIRREREERVGKMQLEREKERQELAREKARDREERLSALHAAQLANQEELQKKIAQKQQESARRHGENIEHIRQRAVESSILKSEEVPPTLKSYTAHKQCSLCNIMIPNEVHLLSHLKGKLHLEAVRKMHEGRELPRDELQRFNITQICDIPASLINNNTLSSSKAAKEKQKALKRRCRKTKQRMVARSQEWENERKNESVQSAVESANKAKFRRNLKELDRLCSNHGKTTWPSVAVAGLERCLGEIARAFDKYCVSDQEAFNSLSGFDTLTNVLNLGLNVQNMAHCLPNKSVASACRVYRAALNGHAGNAEGVLLSNKILVILDLLIQRMEIATGSEEHNQNQESPNNATANGNVATATLQLLGSIFAELSSDKPALQSRLQDIVGYLVAGGLVDRVARHSRDLIETDSLSDQDHESPLLLASLELLSRLCFHLKRCSQESAQHENNNSEQTSSRFHLLASLSLTEAAGAVGALYAALVLPCHNQKGAALTPNQAGLSPATRALAARGLTLLRTIAELDLSKFQELLGAEATSLQFRLVAGHLISRLSRDPQTDKPEVELSQNINFILSELFTVLGYFALNNQENQMVLLSGGAGPSVLQQLCSLPFPFYGDPRLASSTLPALLAATHRNAEAAAVLSCELSYQLLEDFRSSEEGKLNPLVRLLKDGPSL